MWFDAPDVITALREYDGDIEYELPRQRTIEVGASRDCDLSLPNRALSAIHCVLERRGARLRILDHHSTNGTSFGGRKIDFVDISPGDTFTLATTTFLAMNEEMRSHRPIIAEIVGANFPPSPDKILVDAVKGSNHLLITGELGCDQARLARSIHAVSLRRMAPAVEISKIPEERTKQREIITRSGRSTLIIEIDSSTPPMDPSFCAMIFSVSYHIRVIVIAPTTGVARKVLPAESIEQMQHLWIRPLGMRIGDIPDLFDRMLTERAATFRVSDLTPPNQDALCSHEWRDNLIGLRLAADRLTAISRVENWARMDWRERAAAVGVAKSTLYDWFMALRLELPLFVNR